MQRRLHYINLLLAPVPGLNKPGIHNNRVGSDLFNVAPGYAYLLDLAEVKASAVCRYRYRYYLTAGHLKLHVADVSEPPTVTDVYNFLLLKLIKALNMHK